MTACSDRYEVVDSFRDAIAAAGLTPPDQLVPDGQQLAAAQSKFDPWFAAVGGMA